MEYRYKPDPRPRMPARVRLAWGVLLGIIALALTVAWRYDHALALALVMIAAGVWSVMTVSVWHMENS